MGNKDASTDPDFEVATNPWKGEKLIGLAGAIGVPVLFFGTWRVLGFTPTGVVAQSVAAFWQSS